MREYINRLSLSEGIEEFDVRGRSVDVWVNPNKSGVDRLLTKSKYNMVRGFVLDKDVFVWDANSAIHHQIINQVTDNHVTAHRFMLAGDLGTLVDDAEREFEKSRFTFWECAVGFLYCDDDAPDRLTRLFPDIKRIMI